MDSVTKDICNDISRRDFLKTGGVLSGIMALQRSRSWISDLMPGISGRYKIAVADIMILKRQKIGEFALARELSADGVEVDMGGLGTRESFDNKLSDATFSKRFLTAATDNNVQICSLAMTGFYSQSFAQRSTWQQNISDCIATMQTMKVKTAFLPLGIASDLKKHPELRDVLADRLRTAGKMAAAANVVIGIETSLDAAGELSFLHQINAPSIKSYFNFANALDNGRNICDELDILGRGNICQIHCTDTDGVWLQNDPKIDMKAVKKTLDKMRWSGWLVIQRSRDTQRVHDVKYNFTANTTYMKKIFQQ